MTKTTTYLKPSIGFIVGASLVFAFGLFFSVPQANAETNILVSENLTIGSTGSGVVVLQGLLSEMGYMSIPVTVPFGYFGPATKAALARYQTTQSVSPSVGYFGPATKIAMHQHFASHNWLTMLGW